MARPTHFISCGFIASIGLTLAVGCQSNKGMVENLPPPNFSAPTIEAPVVVAPPPAPVQIAPAPLKPAPKPVSGESAWVPNAPARPWKWIVVHHSATPSGSA